MPTSAKASKKTICGEYDDGAPCGGGLRVAEMRELKRLPTELIHYY